MPGGTRSFEIARRLVGAGHQVEMVTSWRNPTKNKGWFITKENGIRVHWLPVPYSNFMGYRGRISAFIKFAVKASTRASELKGDIIYATSTPLTIVLPGFYASRANRIPMVFEVRDLWPAVPIAIGALRSWPAIMTANKLERFAYNRAARIVALTPTMRDYISGKDVSLEKIAVVSNGASIVPFQPLDMDDASKPFTLLYCGSIGPSHGVDYLRLLAKAIKNKGYPIHIKVAGDGKDRPKIEKKAAENNTLNSTISFIGQVKKSEVPELYSSAHASLMTFDTLEILYRHSVQNKFFDSLAAGRPIFANYRGWSTELAEQEDIGVILPAHVYDEAAEIIWNRLNMKTWMKTASAKARRLAESRFSFDVLAGKVESILLETVGD